jgi:putative hydrolase
MEINGKHPHLDIEGIKTAAKYDVKFVISSDAHVPENVGVYKPQLLRALDAGLDPERIVNIRAR